MFALRKRFDNDYFNIIEIKAMDVETLLSVGVALFNSSTHAQYAQAKLCAISAPTWSPDFQQHGHLLSQHEPLFCPFEQDRFTQDWLQLMCQETRLHLARLNMDSVVFELHPDEPAPGPWTILRLAPAGDYLVVDSKGRVLCARDKELLQQSQQRSFANELIMTPGKHLDIIEVY